ncbi:hypothetical protein Tco_0317558 [Tanacetum coccineum]
MVSNVKLPILKKGEYTLWSMRMEQYLTNTDYSLWQMILNGDGPIQVTTDENGVETEVPPKTAQALLARQRERKAKSILLLAILDEYQLRFHAIKDAKTLWAAIKNRFGGNVKSKKMQKNVLNQQFENFSVFDIEGLDKAYDRFQKLISLLEVHGAVVSNEDANQKFLRALPSSWNNVALIMRNKAGIDDLDIDDLYNNLKLFEADIKGSSGSTLTLSESGLDSLQKKLAAVMKDNALIVQDGLGYDWSYVAQDEPTEFALMAYTSNSLGSNTEANLEIVAYQLGLESIEAQLIVHQKNEVAYEEKIAVLEFEVKDKIVQVMEMIIKQFKKDNGYHDVPPPLTGNYMPPLADLSFTGLDDSVYRPTTNKTSSKCLVELSLKIRNEPVKPKQAEKPRMITQNPKRMAKFVLKNMGKVTGHREVRPVWNNTQRINHQNKFVSFTVLTRFRRVPVSAAKQSSFRAATSTGAVKQVNTATHTNRVNVSKTRTNTFHKSHSPIRRPFHKSTALNISILNEIVNTIRVKGVNTAGQTAVSAIKGNGVTTVKASADCVWRPKMTDLNNVSKDNNRSWVSKRVNYIDPQGKLKHMTGNKDFLTGYQAVDGGFVAFGSGTR